MKKLYYILMSVSLMWLSACQEDGTEVVNLTYADAEITATDITPSQGYVGEQVVITGTEFGNSTEFMKVYFGDFQGEMVGCADERMVVKVPEEAVSGKIILEVLGKKMMTDLTFTVLDNPVLSITSSVTPIYAGDEISFAGTGMPATADDLTVTLGDETQAEIASYVADENGNATFGVLVSKRQLSGTYTLRVKLFEREVFSKRITVLPAPEVDTLDNRFVRTDKELTITGSGFRDFVGNAQVDFNGTLVSPTKIEDTKMSVAVPTDFSGGPISVILGNFASFALGEAKVLAKGDITGLALKNCGNPFMAASGAAGIPADWVLDNYKGNALLFPEGDANGLLALGAANQDAKVYQVATFPKGTYKITLNVAECSTTGGRFGVLFTVAKGHATIPNIVDRKPWYFVDDTDVLTYYRITDTIGAHQKVVEFTLNEDTELTIGFVIQLLNAGTVKLSSIQMTME